MQQYVLGTALILGLKNEQNKAFTWKELTF